MARGQGWTGSSPWPGGQRSRTAKHPEAILGNGLATPTPDLRFLRLERGTMQAAPTPEGLRQCHTHAFMHIYTLPCPLTRASVTLNSRRIYWGMLYSAIGSTTKYW